MYIFLFVLLEKNEDKDAIIILELVKLEKTYWLCIMKNLTGYFAGRQGDSCLLFQQEKKGIASVDGVLSLELGPQLITPSQLRFTPIAFVFYNIY